MRVFNVRAGNVFRRWFAAAALVCLWVGALSHANAAQVSRSEFNAFMDLATGAGKHTVGMGSGGTPLVTRGVPGPNQVGNMNLSHSNGGWPRASGQFDMNMPDGRKGTFNGSQGFSKASTGGALARFASKIFLPVSAGLALYQLIKELWPDAEITEFPGGGWEIKNRINICTNGQCLVYWSNHPSGWGPNPKPWQPTRQGACNVAAADYNNKGISAYIASVTWTPKAGLAHGECLFEIRNRADNALINPASPRAVEATTVPGDQLYEHITEQQLADTIAAKSGWPTSSAVSKALADALNDPNVDKKLETEGTTEVTGPSSVEGGTKTKTGSDGSTSTTTTTWNINITGPTISITSSVVTTTTNPDGSTTTETETEEPEKKENCDAGSQTVGCAELDTPTGEIPRREVSVSYTEENLGFGSGSCPADLTVNVQGKALTIFKFAPGCALLSNYVKPIVLVISTIIAFFILMPGGKPE